MKDCSQIIPPSTDEAQHDSPTVSSGMVSIVQHKSLHQKSRFWGNVSRSSLEIFPMARWSPTGCGAMHLRLALESSNHRGVHYIPVDAVHRGDAAMRLCNLNKHEYPLNRIRRQPSSLRSSSTSTTSCSSYACCAAYP